MNGTTIFSKLPVYLRMYYERWERNQRVRDAVKSSKTELQLLQQVNDESMLLPSGTPNRTSAPDEDTDDSFDFGTNVHIDDGEDAGATQESEVPSFAVWVDVAAPTSMAQPQHRAIRPHQQLGPPIVGGLVIGLTPDNLPTERRNHKQGHRGRDTCTRRRRSCVRCSKNNGSNGLLCNHGV